MIDNQHVDVRPACSNSRGFIHTALDYKPLDSERTKRLDGIERLLGAGEADRPSAGRERPAQGDATHCMARPDGSPRIGAEDNPRHRVKPANNADR